MRKDVTMLSLKNIKKDYKMGDMSVEALRGVSVDFRENEFVAILGQSGCGKTTLLNIIGGLDRYSDGDLIINGVSTKQYKDRDWDSYRNHKIGFVFQSYNLIPHQTVLSNVELALTLSGVSKTEHRRRAIEVLEKVGLKDQMKKKPNQMSGGQMQRVAIARALINDPDILLADEPTGALDTETSVQIMEILKEIAKDKLIIMVTHNPDLAEEYSTRIIRLVDGKITGDSDPYEATQTLKDKPDKVRKTSMSFFTAMSLSLNNLMTKKGRTILTSFAGSIGIIGIALILSLSHGVQNYIDDIQHDTLASYPLSIDESSTDISSFLQVTMDTSADIADDKSNRPKDKIYSSDRLYNVFDLMYAQTNVNDLKTFKEFIDDNAEIKTLVSNIEYSYGLTLQVYRKMDDNSIKQVNPNGVLDDIGFGFASGLFDIRSSMASSSQNIDIFSEITDDEKMFNTKYELVAGSTPSNYNEVVFIIDKNNEITDYTLYALGMRDTSAVRSAIRDMMQKKDKNAVESVEASEDYEYSDFIGMTFSVIPNPMLYKKNGDTWDDMSDDADYLMDIYDKGVELKIVGIIREKEASSGVSGRVGYTRALTAKVSEMINSAEIVKIQQDNPDYDVFNGLPFEGTEAGDAAEANAKIENERKQQEALETQQKIQAAVVVIDKLKNLAMPSLSDLMTTLTMDQLTELAQLPQDQQQLYILNVIPMDIPDITPIISILPEEQQQAMSVLSDNEKLVYLLGLINDENFNLSYTMPEDIHIPDIGIDMSSIGEDQLAYFMSLSEEERADLMAKFGVKVGSDVVSASSQYTNLKTLGVISMDTPSSISIYPMNFEAKERIVDIIADYNANHDEDHQITYTDIVGMFMSSVTDIVNAISYILIAFVAISLIVSSIMIGIITYISVLERTKEIGILRSIGASKKDISRVFNAETVIIGLTSGCIGIGVTLLLLIPINIIIESITNIAGLAVLPWVGAIALIGISMLLTLIAGLMPSRVAAKKDPVIALRTE